MFPTQLIVRKIRKLAYATLPLMALSSTGCAERSIDIIDPQGKVVGECMAGYDWHLYGLEDSIDYMLYQCAKDHLATGHSISNNAILNKDYSLPSPPPGKSWNKALAMHEFKQKRLTERKLGYLLAQLEWDFRVIEQDLENQLANKTITEEQAKRQLDAARKIWLG